MEEGASGKIVFDSMRDGKINASRASLNYKSGAARKGNASHMEWRDPPFETSISSAIV